MPEMLSVVPFTGNDPGLVGRDGSSSSTGAVQASFLPSPPRPGVLGALFLSLSPSKEGAASMLRGINEKTKAHWPPGTCTMVGPASKPHALASKEYSEPLPSRVGPSLPWCSTLWSLYAAQDPRPCPLRGSWPNIHHPLLAHSGPSPWLCCPCFPSLQVPAL